MVALVAVENLAPEFDLGTLLPSKISLKLGQGLAKDADGNVVFDPASFDIAQLVKDNESTTELSYDSPTATLTFTNEAGAVATIDLSALTTDLFVQGGQFDAASLVLTLRNVDTTQPDVTVPLAALKVVETLDSATISLSGTGEAGTPLTADVTIDPSDSNLLQSSTAGLLVDSAAIAPPLDISVTDAFGVPLFEAGTAA